MPDCACRCVDPVRRYGCSDGCSDADGKVTGAVDGRPGVRAPGRSGGCSELPAVARFSAGGARQTRRGLEDKPFSSPELMEATPSPLTPVGASLPVPPVPASFGPTQSTPPVALSLGPVNSVASSSSTFSAFRHQRKNRALADPYLSAEDGLSRRRAARLCISR